MSRLRLEGLTSVATAINRAGLVNGQYPNTGEYHSEVVKCEKYFASSVKIGVSVVGTLLVSNQKYVLSPKKDATVYRLFVLKNSSGPPDWLQVNHYFLIADTLSLE